MKSKVYCFASPKGGSGKTVICASFAAFLGELGKKVLMIDVDLATRGLTLFYLSEVTEHKDAITINGKEPHGFLDSEPSTSGQDVVHLPGKVDLIPATFDFGVSDEIPGSQINSALIRILQVVRSEYDYIFLDAQAGTGPGSRAAMAREVSDEIIIVTEYDPLSAAGVERLKALMQNESLYLRTWVLLNKILPDFAEAFGEFLEVARYLSPIPWFPDVVRAYARRTLALDVAYGNQFTLAVMQTLRGLLGPDMSSRIDEWAEGRASSIRQPIEDQYKDAEKELKGLLERKDELEKTRAFHRLARLMVSITFPVAAVVTFVTAFPSVFRQLLIMPDGFDSRTVVAVLVMVLTGLLTTWVFYSGPWRKTAQMEVNEARLNRQLSILEEKLKRLEILRKADLRTLVVDRQRSPH